MRRIAVAVAFALSAHAPAVVVYVNPPVAAWWRQPPPVVFADLNADGRTDFGFTVSVVNMNYNGETTYGWGATNGSGFSSAPLSAGSLVGPSTGLTTVGQQLGDWSWTREPEPPYDTFYSVSMNLPEGDSFWGLRFHDAAGTDHYGWLRFHGHATSTDLSISVVDYAYETDAGVPITVGAIPAPSALTVMATLGLMSARRSRGRVAPAAPGGGLAVAEYVLL
jgi:hypothetical protein